MACVAQFFPQQSRGPTEPQGAFVYSANANADCSSLLFGIVVVAALVILFGAICKCNRLEISLWDAPVAGHDEPVAHVADALLDLAVAPRSESNSNNCILL